VTATRTPRVAPLPQEQWDDDVAAALRAGFGDAAAERLLATGPDAMRAPNAVSTLMRHPRLAGRFLAYNSVLLFDPVLEPRVREILVLRVAFRTGSEYEWAQHVRLAGACGITPEQIDAVTRGRHANEWTPFERDLLAATDQLVDHYRVDDETWARLAEVLDERQRMELVFVVGTYTCLAMAFNSFGIELDPDLQPAAAGPEE
jgi:4-carboxymuconolactone decarboxylase